MLSWAGTTTNSGSSAFFPGPGIEVVGAAGANQQVGEGFLTTINGGYFAQEQLSFNDYLTGTVGGRYDFSSAFGTEAAGVFYPKVSVSYVVSDHEAVAAKLPSWISTLRLRAAWGTSGSFKMYDFCDVNVTVATLESSEPSRTL